MTVLDEVIGGLLIGTWANSFLYMLEIIQAIHYFHYYPGDALIIKGVVTILLVNDGISTLGCFANVYLITVTHWGYIEYMEHQSWPMGLYLTTTALSAAIVQGFLIFRWWSLTKNLLISGLLVFMMTVAFGGSMASLVILLRLSQYQRGEHRAIISATIWLGAGAATDIAVALSLMWQLSKVKTSFKSTRSLLRRLSSSAFQTGLAPSLMAAFTLITFITDTDSNVCAAFGQCLGRVYACTMLFNLNRRRSHRRLLPTGGDGSMVLHNSLDTSFGGIHVHHPALVHNDEERSRESCSDPALSDNHKVELQVIKEEQ